MPFRVESNYRQVSANLKKLDKAVNANFKKASRASVAGVVAEARGIAASHGFQRVPGAIVPTVTPTYVGIRVKAKSSVAGVLHERSRGKWRHPVFGNRAVWVDQNAQPSVKPAADRNRVKVVADVKVAMRAAAAEAGFH